MNKKHRPYIQAARKHGARIESGKKHIKIYDGPHLVIVFPHGGKSYEGRGDMKMAQKLFRERGWME